MSKPVKTAIFPIIVTIFLLSTALLYGESATDTIESAYGIEDHYNFFHSHFPRYDGSENEQKVFEYIENKLIENNIAYSSHDFSDFTDAYSFSKNIEAVIPGASKDTLLMVVPVNHPIETDKDTESWNLAIGLGYLLYSMEQAAKGGPLPMGLTVLFAGGEYGSESGRQLGSELFLESYFPEENVAVLYLQFQDIPGTIRLGNGENNFISPYWIINRSAESLKYADLPYELGLEYTQLYRLGASEDSSSITEYLKQEFPALEISSLSSDDAAKVGTGDPQLWLASLLKSFDYFMNKQDGKIPAQWDRHYIYIQLGSLELVLTEGEYIPLLLSLFTAILLFILFFRRRMGKYRKVLFRKFWILIVLFILIFIFLIFGTYVIRSITALRNFPALWQQRPVVFFFLKISAAVSFFFFIFRFVKTFPFPVIRSFYSASSILLFFLLMAAVSVFNISLTYYFVWAFFWTILFSIFHNRFVKLLCLLMSSFFLIFGLYQLFDLQANAAIQFLLFSPLFGNLFLSLLLLPFILMIIRTSLAFHDKAARGRHIYGWVLYAIPLAGFVGLVVYGFLFIPFNAENHKSIRIQELINYELQERKLTAVSDAPLGTINFGGAEFEDLTAHKTNRAALYSEDLPELLDITYEKDEFLDRKYYSISIHSKGEPVHIKMLLQSEKPLVLYDSNFPFQIVPSENKGEIFIGAFPPNPLTIEIVVPKEIEVEAEFIVEYLKAPYKLDMFSENADISHTVTCIQWLEL